MAGPRITGVSLSHVRYHHRRRVQPGICCSEPLCPHGRHRELQRFNRTGFTGGVPIQLSKSHAGALPLLIYIVGCPTIKKHDPVWRFLAENRRKDLSKNEVDFPTIRAPFRPLTKIQSSSAPCVSRHHSSVLFQE